MQKFSLFDFLAFIVPGSTMLIVVYAWFTLNFPNTYLVAQVDSSLWVIPMLFFSFILGNIISWVGTSFDRWIDDKRIKIFQTVITKFFIEQADCEYKKLITFIFPEYNIVNFERQVTTNKQAKELYKKVDAFLDVQEKNKLPQILQSQYAFFRNAMVTCMLMAFFFLGITIISQFTKSLQWNWSCFFAFLMLFCASCFSYKRMLKRKELMIEYAFRNLFALMRVKS